MASCARRIATSATLNGPSDENPDPISATASTQTVARLNRKRKPPTKRTAYGKRFRTSYEKFAAESLLMLPHSTSVTGKNADEMDVAETLLCLNTDTVPVSSSSVTKLTQETSHSPSHESGQSTSFSEDKTVLDGCKPDVVTCATQTTITFTHMQSFSDTLLINKKDMARALFIQNVENRRKTCHYTGLDISVLRALYSLIKEKASRIHTWKGSRKTKDKYVKSQYLQQKYGLSKLTVWEQLILTLVRLRRKPSISMLADLFGVATGTASRTFISWILFLEQELSFLLPFSTIDEMDGLRFPKAFREIPNLRGIIDCTEFYIEKPGRLPSQRSTYSNYKSRNTFKLFLSISPVPHFNFVSNLFSGSISDKEIVRQCGFLDKLMPGDVIMADKGFNIQDLLALRETRLLAPPIMRKGAVSSKASTATRRIAKVRIHVERLIRKLKCFGILRGVITPLIFSIVNETIY